MIKKIQEQFKRFSEHTIGIVLLYTAIWLILAGLILFIFNKNEKSFVWLNDGLHQHFASFGYLCDYLGDLIRNFHFDGFFNFTLGQGMDVLTTLNSFDFTDPISILSAFVFPLSRVGRYTLMIFIKLYLVGISFLFYCHVTDLEKGMVTAAGAIAYAFCGAVLFTFARHPNFINWAYFFPFLLGGVELYFREKKKLPLILFVFLNIITSYYTFYMNVVLVAIYVLVTEIYKIVKGEVIREEFIKCLKMVGVCCIGVLLSAFILFPSIYAFLTNNRIGELTGYTESALLYEDEFYKNIFEIIFSPYWSGEYYSLIGINVILFIPLVLIFTKRKQYTGIKAIFLLSLIMLGVPLAGRIMNGLGYATNRFAYVLPFYASVIFVIMFDEIKTMSEKEQVIVLLSVIIYVTLCFLHTETNEDVLKVSTLIMLIAIVVIVSIALRYKYPAIEPLILILVFLCAGFSVYFTFSEYEGDYVSTFRDNTDIYPTYTNISTTAVPELSNDTNFYRTEMADAQGNVNGRNKVNGTGEFHWSLVPGNMMDFYTGLAVDSVKENCNVGNLDGRTGLLELSGVKYYTRPATEDGLVPYGYEEVPSKDDRYQVFENSFVLPIGYTYTNYIPYSEYEEMTGIEKEQALLQGAVLEQDLDDYTIANTQFDYMVLDYDVDKTEGVTLKDNGIEPITEENGDINREIRLQVNIPSDCEIYVYLSNTEVGDEVSLLNVTVTREKGSYSISKTAQLSNLTFNWPSLQDDVAFNLGIGHAGMNTITISLNQNVRLAFDNMQIIAVPMSSYEKYAEDLGEYVLEDVTVGTDQIDGTITIPSKRILQFSVPYSDGWKAYVDGEEVSIMESDVMYMAIPISAGTHSVELRYETPYLRIGMVVTLATAVLYVVYEIIRYKRKHNAVKEAI